MCKDIPGFKKRNEINNNQVPKQYRSNNIRVFTEQFLDAYIYALYIITLKAILVCIAEGELLGRRAIRDNNGANFVHRICRNDTDSMISTMDKGSISVDV